MRKQQQTMKSKRPTPLSCLSTRKNGVLSEKEANRGAVGASGRRPEAEIIGDGNERGEIGKVGTAHC
jgi:hypothetical protein